jgi:hypothetical protein
MNRKRRSFGDQDAAVWCVDVDEGWGRAGGLAHGMSENKSSDLYLGHGAMSDGNEEICRAFERR